MNASEFFSLFFAAATAEVIFDLIITHLESKCLHGGLRQTQFVHRRPNRPPGGINSGAPPVGICWRHFVAMITNALSAGANQQRQELVAVCSGASLFKSTGLEKRCLFRAPAGRSSPCLWSERGEAIVLMFHRGQRFVVRRVDAGRMVISRVRPHLARRACRWFLALCSMINRPVVIPAG